MKNTKLPRLLATLSKSELKEFEKFISSPFFSRGRNLVPFFNVIKRYYPDFDENKFTNENVYAKLFPGKVYNKNSIDILKTQSHELLKLCKEFLIQTDFRDNSSMRMYHLLKKLREKKLYDEFERHYEIEIRKNEDSFGGSIYDYIDRFFLLETNNQYCVEAKKYREAFDTIAAMDETMIAAGLMRAYRAVENIHLAVNGYNLKRPQNYAEEFLRLFDSAKFLELLKVNGNKYFPYIEMNYLFFMISQYPMELSYYFEFKKFVFANYEKFGHIERYIMLSRMLSYCVHFNSIKFDQRMIREEFEIYKTMFSIGVYKWSANDNLNIHLYKNTVYVSSKLKEYCWLEDFIERFTDELARNDRENLRNYAYALLNFGRKNYEKALEYTSRIKFTIGEFKMDLKYLLFKIYYEMESIEQAHSMIETMRQFIQRTKDLHPGNRKKMSLVVKFAKELLKIRSTGQRVVAEHLLKKLESTDEFHRGNWLSEKFEELCTSSANVKN